MNSRTLLRVLSERLQEKSTWAGLGVALAVLAGRSITPEYADAIGTVGAFLASVVLVLTKEAGHSQDAGASG